MRQTYAMGFQERLKGPFCGPVLQPAPATAGRGLRAGGRQSLPGPLAPPHAL